MPDPSAAPAPWDSNELWMKSKLFINYALADDTQRTVDERALWASLSLELLGKAALSRVSPILIATPTEDGRNLLASVGLSNDRAAFKSILASTVFKRCAVAFKPFDADAAIKIAESRNAFLHSGTPELVSIPEAAWWPRFWALAQVLVHACDRTLEELVGYSNLAAVEAALAQNRRNIEDRLHMLVERATQRLARYEAGTMNARELKDWERSTDLTIGLRYSETVHCPACHQDTGTLEGDEILSSDMHYEQLSEEDFDSWVDLEVAAEYFSCRNCRCVLDSYELLVAARLPETIAAQGEPSDFYEPDGYGND